MPLYYGASDDNTPLGGSGLDVCPLKNGKGIVRVRQQTDHSVWPRSPIKDANQEDHTFVNICSNQQR
jgi:hypothetical protein